MALSYMNWDHAFQASSQVHHHGHCPLSETSYREFSQAFSHTTFHHLPHNYSIGGCTDDIYYSTTNYDFRSPSPPPLQDHNLVNNCFNIMITGGTNGDYHQQQQQQPPFPEFDSFSSCGYSYEFEAASKHYSTSTCPISPLPRFDQTAAQPLNGIATVMKKRSLSAQSIAARQRRRKISDKTQELGKLIPGGQKMNTADMFHAAYKYIKFLQAQVGILQFMDDQQQQENDEISEQVRGLVKSTLVQEKLMCAEKCLVPRKLVESLQKNDDKYFFQTNMASQILEEVRQLIIIS